MPATVLSFGAQAHAAGQIAGGPLFGWIAGHHSTGLAMAAAGMSLLPGLMLVLWARRSHLGRGAHAP